MTECDAVKAQDRDRDNGRRIGRGAVGLVSHQPKGLGAALVVLLAAIIFVSPAQAQPPTTPDCSTGRDLITIPEVTHENGKLRAVLMLSDEYRAMSDGDRCLWQHLRYFKGWNAEDYWKARNAAKPPPTWPSNQEPLPKGEFPGEPIPGPTLRARTGDLIQISFLNQIDTKNFPFSLDRGEGGHTSTGCDEARGTLKVDVYPRNDKMPNCLHGSSTANIHFHGTHTTPSTTGDNVLLYIRPALRVKGEIQSTDDFVKSTFDKFFNWCEQNKESPARSPTRWEQLPSEWQEEQERLLRKYDATAPYKGIPGNLPDEMKLWPRNEADIKKGLWPQYSVGAFPYCFRLPDYEDYKKGKVKMAQAPGTHWYHAHKHGSTALNVGNGMTGAFIIEGPYDDKLRDFYKNAPGSLEERVLVIQQLETSLSMLSANASGPAPLSVNGRHQPIITMRPGQVQLWRIVNGAPRSSVQFLNFVPPSGTSETVEWRQTAQDGVQFHPDNYEKVGQKNAKFNMAAANRVDLLVKAPKMPGSHALQVVESVVASPPEGSSEKVTLLTVNVTGEAINPPMEFIDKGSFPPFPEFLKDLPASEGYHKRTLVFDTKPGPGRGDVLPLHEINDKLFSNEIISQTMGVDTVEEWTMVNKAVGIAHPFHIHINPFQVVEVFEPDSEEAKEEGGPCYADPKKPETWKPCDKLEPPFVWRDVRAIPSARTVMFDCDACPSGSGDACSFDAQKCTVKIPGYFKMRSRFADFLGQFVQHCHILAHEDRGMMQLIQVSEKRIDSIQKSGYTHD